jgi:poly-gamma-glutamate synthesis protein (capsule biosynthesis protein)
MKKSVWVGFIALFLGLLIGSISVWKNERQNIINQSSNRETAPLRAVSIITPHHLLAKGLIEEIFQRIQTENQDVKIERIILLSPNHFNLGNGWFIVSDKNREVENGTISSDNEMINDLVSRRLLYKDNKAFQKEHGIDNILPFIKKYFPDSKIIPVIIKENAPVNKTEVLARYFAEGSQNTLVILSADFAHNFSSAESDVFDKDSILAISNLDFSKINNLKIDCPSGLYLLMKFSEMKNFRKFNLIANLNAQKITNSLNSKENTSYITGFFTKTNK